MVEYMLKEVAKQVSLNGHDEEGSANYVANLLMAKDVAPAKSAFSAQVAKVGPNRNNRTAANPP